MTAKEIIENDEVELTEELLRSLKAKELKIVAKEIFNLSDKLFDTEQLRQQCIEKLNYELNKQTVKDFVSKQENQVDAIKTAIRFRQGFGREWFTPGDVVLRIRKNNKTATPDLKEITNQLNILSLFKLVKIKKIKGISHYRINLLQLEKSKLRKLEEEKKSQNK